MVEKLNRKQGTAMSKKIKLEIFSDYV